MPIFLPVAGICLSLLSLAAVGAVVGSLSGLFGVGGGFLLTPILMMIGIPPTVAAASGSCQMVATSSSGTAAHFRLGNVDIKMGTVLLIGGLAGAAVGVDAIKILRVLEEADLVITLSYVLVLGGLGSYMFFQSLRTLRRGAIVKGHSDATGAPGLLGRLPWQLEFPRSGVRHSILVPLFLSAIVGVLASIMGVGGGFIMLPMMVYLLAMPTHVAVGTSLFQILALSAGITFMQADANRTVDLVLVLPLALSSAMGAQIGARVSRLLRGEQLMILLAILVLGVTGKMTIDLFSTPRDLLAPLETEFARQSTAPLERYALGLAGPATITHQNRARAERAARFESASDTIPIAHTRGDSPRGRWMGHARTWIQPTARFPQEHHGEERATNDRTQSWADTDRHLAKKGTAVSRRFPGQMPALATG
jgi:uncharacterized membrane protein YfcA